MRLVQPGIGDQERYAGRDMDRKTLRPCQLEGWRMDPELAYQSMPGCHFLPSGSTSGISRCPFQSADEARLNCLKEKAFGGTVFQTLSSSPDGSPCFSCASLGTPTVP